MAEEMAAVSGPTFNENAESLAFDSRSLHTLLPRLRLYRVF